MKNILVWISLMLILPTVTSAQNVTDYLINTDIGQYLRSYPGECSKHSGVIVGAEHFEIDHTDYTCDIRYYNETLDNGVEVEVTKHSGADSDKWLLHEVERDFRTYYGLPGSSYVMRTIEGQTIMAVASGGREYRWLSGNKVIRIAYTDQMLEKPEPFEIVKAYLAKQPSTLTPMTSADLRTPENKTKWIKDEMDRRLWLCDKWFYQLQLGKVQQSEVIQQAVKSMEVFLNYREKYYGIASANEKQLLWGYRDKNDGTSIKAKLKEYKDWWNLNKDKAITLP